MNGGPAGRGIGGFTLLELLIVVTVVLILTSMGAIALTSRIPSMKFGAQTTLVLKLLRSARERALADKKTWKVRIHQTRRVANVQELFRTDGDKGDGTGIIYGTHQYIFAAPVEAWYQTVPSAAVLSTKSFPMALKTLPTANYDVGIPVVPILTITDIAANPPGVQFPVEMASLRLPGIVELEDDVRIVSINGRTTWTAGTTYYGDGPNFDQPIPRLPNANPPLGNPPRPSPPAQPAPPNPPTADDRITDATYAPDGVFRFQPAHPAGPNNDFTVTFSNLTAQVAPANVDAISQTITLDYTTGFPHF